MKIGIIGAGFTGLAAAYELVKKGHEVTIFEKDPQPGGLAIGYQEKGWDWTLESHYHHWFTNDTFILTLAKELGHPVVIKRPETSSFVDNGIYQLDSPLSLLRFEKLSFMDRIRMGISLAILRYNPFWKPFEHYKAQPYLQKTMGKKAYEKIWKPLLTNKLGKYAPEVSLAWFWARIYKRTSDLAYPEGGFLAFAQHLTQKIEKMGGKIIFHADVSCLASTTDDTILTYSTNAAKNQTQHFDNIIVTVPSFIFTKIAPDLSEEYKKKLLQLRGIGAMNLILRLKKPFFANNTYWLNMCDVKSPILAIVEHTNFMNSKNYNNEHIVYLGNYMETTDPRFLMTDKELLQLYDPWIKKINPNYADSLISYRLFKAPFAQPIIPINYSHMIPPFDTPLPHVYLANMQQVYPWDRGTNYAVELGQKIVQYITEK